MKTSLASQVSQKGTIYYDGLCILCSREIDHYRRQVGAENFNFVDITAPDFSAEDHHVDPFEVHKIMHVKGVDGKLYTKVDAFIEIWSHLPKYQLLSKFAKQPWLRPLLDMGYLGFSKVRPFLPKRKTGCDTSPYCETKI